MVHPARSSAVVALVALVVLLLALSAGHVASTPNPLRGARLADAAPALPSHTALSAASFVDSLGVNTHFPFTFLPQYANVALGIKAIQYLGVKNLRDSAEPLGCAPMFAQVARATGAKFDDFIGEASPDDMNFDLGCVPSLASQGVLNYIEGGNEEDDSYAANLGNTLAITAKFQQEVYAEGQLQHLPVINMSFGAGWTAANNWQGDYGNVGDLSAICDYANAHTYPVAGQTPDATIQRLNGLAHLAAASRPVMTTEYGYDTSVWDPTAAAEGILAAAFDATKDGDTKIYFYALFDDQSGDYGLMNTDGTPKPAGLALHDLTTLLGGASPAAASFKPGSLQYQVTGEQSGDNELLLEKPDGSFWLALWNETGSAHTVSVALPHPTDVNVFDPVQGTAPIARDPGRSVVSVTVPNHPVLVEIPAGM